MPDDTEVILSIDLGGTKIAYCLSETNGKPLICEKKATEIDFLSQLRNIYVTLEENYDKKIDVVSIGVPGPVTNGILGPCALLMNTKPISFIECFPNLKSYS